MGKEDELLFISLSLKGLDFMRKIAEIMDWKFDKQKIKKSVPIPCKSLIFAPEFKITNANSFTNLLDEFFRCDIRIYLRVIKRDVLLCTAPRI